MDADFQKKLERALTWAGTWQPAICTMCEPHWHYGEHFNSSHDIPCPALTDELAMRLLRRVCLQYRVQLSNVFEHNGHFRLNTCKDWQGGPSKQWPASPDPARAIVLAVAALSEQSEK